MERTQVILITGASSGFGKVTAQTLAGKGYVVYGTSRRIANGNIGQIRMLIADVTDENSVRSAVNRIMDEQGHIDVLINNAGMGIGGALEMATDEESLRRWIQTSWVWYACVEQCYPLCENNGRGKLSISVLLPEG